MNPFFRPVGPGHLAARSLTHWACKPILSSQVAQSRPSRAHALMSPPVPDGAAATDIEAALQAACSALGRPYGVQEQAMAERLKANWYTQPLDLAKMDAVRGEVVGKYQTHVSLSRTRLLPCKYPCACSSRCSCRLALLPPTTPRNPPTTHRPPSPHQTPKQTLHQSSACWRCPAARWQTGSERLRSEERQQPTVLAMGRSIQQGLCGSGRWNASHTASRCAVPLSQQC